ncbi:hypothetical protein PR202_ga19968 [Eleusine coracana subsp. coracana]|uniref:Uncharacterized protein n=1 Tax=Eleusine coracana subsp. coracana TaxID=191504 RepID=A0AAV5CWJ2_ELECO|nr:hypothetical protein PR202_ga19968 [Eleusine coracana subsp. coracana]
MSLSASSFLVLPRSRVLQHLTGLCLGHHDPICHHHCLSRLYPQLDHDRRQLDRDLPSPVRYHGRPRLDRGLSSCDREACHDPNHHEITSSNSTKFLFRIACLNRIRIEDIILHYLLNYWLVEQCDYLICLTASLRLFLFQIFLLTDGFPTAVSSVDHLHPAERPGVTADENPMAPLILAASHHPHCIPKFSKDTSPALLLTRTERKFIR